MESLHEADQAVGAIMESEPELAINDEHHASVAVL